MKYGIVAAVLLGNLVHWIRENRKTDPKYTWHSMSPRELAKHLPFPKTTLQRAFADLVKANVIKTKGPEGRGGAIQYAVVDETRLANAEGSGSKLDMGGGPNLDEGGPVLDMGGPKLDMPGPNLDMGGPNLDNNTTLIDNPLKDDPLKDPSYVEPGASNPLTHSSKTDKLKDVKGVYPFRSIPAFGPHTRNRISSKESGSAKSEESAKSPKSASSVSSGQSDCCSVPGCAPNVPTSFLSSVC